MHLAHLEVKVSEGPTTKHKKIIAGDKLIVFKRRNEPTFSPMETPPDVITTSAASRHWTSFVFKLSTLY